MNHPDSHALLDWPLYGPQNERISELVEQLAMNHSLRLDEIENLMVEALQTRLLQLTGEEG